MTTQLTTETFAKSIQDIGHQPNTDFLDGKLALDDKGYIQTQVGTAKTSVAGIFTAGDVQDPKIPTSHYCSR